jgi:hypothetical protein
MIGSARASCVTATITGEGNESELTPTHEKLTN